MLTDVSLSCPNVKATGSHSGSALEPSPGSPVKDERAQGTNLQTGTQRPPPQGTHPPRGDSGPLWAEGTPGMDSKQAHTHNPEHAST